MSETIVRLPYSQVLGWTQSNMVAVRHAAENGDDKMLQDAVKTAIVDLSWNPYTTGFGSLPYHRDSSYAARVREATRTVQNELSDQQKQFFWRFVDMTVDQQTVLFNDTARMTSATTVSDGLRRPVHVRFEGGIYIPCMLN